MSESAELDMPACFANALPDPDFKYLSKASAFEFLNIKII
jgi:hypothetical protein